LKGFANSTNLVTLGDGELNMDDFFALTDIIFGVDGKDIAAINKKLMDFKKKNPDAKNILNQSELEASFKNKYGADNIISVKIDDLTGRTMIETTAGKKGGWNKLLNKDLIPSADYQVGKALYKTDKKGRVNEVSANLDYNKADSNGHQQTAAGETNGIKDGQSTDEGGHLIASILNGTGDQINYLPMTKNLNRGQWRKMENKWARALKETPPKNVDIKIKPVYTGNSKRPSEYRVEYTIDHIVTKEKFNN
jgi:hypothetical protein